ncbi:MAG TPA: shikimate dehydrogenase [Anaerolineales bacterium]|nr:shikimate dehydrogenase [Anaerolineales bacterium]
MRETYSLGLIGYPLSHSLSPKLHNAALKSLGLDGEYCLYAIPPSEENELKELLETVRSGEIHGLNVTIPHKQTVIPYVDELTPTAQAVGAVNTIYFRDGKLIGDNTDAPGFLADLKQFLVNIPYSEFRKNALVLGAGGSARAVVYALLQDGWQITLAARRPEQAKSLADNLSQNSISNIQYPISIIQFPISNLESPFSLIVNTTPLGMTPNVNNSPWPTDFPFPENAAVYDLVYNPRETLLVSNARAAGLPATTGVGMLIEQAALAFEIWTGREAPRDVMRDAVYLCT